MNLLTLAQGDDLLMPHVLPHKIGEIAGYTLTNHHVMTLLAAGLVLLVFAYVAARVKPRSAAIEEHVTKGRLAQTFEAILEYFREEVTRPALGNLTDKYIGFVWTTFFFILFCNLLGMIPIGSILSLTAEPLLGKVMEHPPHMSHWGGTATGNINVTAGLALVSFFMIHFVGIREKGLHYFAHFNPGPWYMAPLLVPLEAMGSLVKPFALAVRLFANMVAGHLVLAALIGLIFMAGAASASLGYGTVVPAMAGALALSLLELFVAFLQAYIFAFLTVLFIAAGVAHDEEHEHAEEHGVREPAGEAHAPAVEPGVAAAH